MPNAGETKCINGNVYKYNGSIWKRTTKRCKDPGTTGNKPKGGCPSGYKWDRQFQKCVKK